MKTRNKILLTFGCCLLCFGGAFSVSAQEMDRSMQSPMLNISPDIQGQERAVIAPLMSSLPPEDRENVILYAQDGNVYVNKPELRAQASPLIQVQENLYQDKMGSLFSIPADTPKPTQNAAFSSTVPSLHQQRPLVWSPDFYGGSGPYRQVYSKVPVDDNTPGFSYEDAYIYLPSARRGSKIGPDPMRGPGHYRYGPRDIQENPKLQDTAYVYMGGWSAKATFIPTTPTAKNPVRTTSFATDAGFYHDKKPRGANKDSWVMFIGPETSVYGSPVDRVAERAGAFRVFSGQTAFFVTFFVSYGAGRTYLNLTARADAMDQVTGADLGVSTWTMAKEVTQPSTNIGKIVDGFNQLFCPWNINGNGMVLKRMTSIAQQVAGPDGSVLQDNPTTCSYIKNAVWSSCRIAVSANAGTQAPWGANYGGVFNYEFKPILNLHNVVMVSQSDTSNETDSVVIP